MTQINLTIPDMHCNGCLRAITRLAQKLDPQAQVSADLPTRRASFTGALDEAALRAALARAGYQPG
ncbi:MAG: copper chaperone [Alphaproteobacteria bacterium]|jgi:copper chaperone|nr:copper chaperone [Alphaproteobacteria bacterium]